MPALTAEHLTLLRRPPTPDEVQFKAQTMNENGNALVVPFIDARFVQERLDDLMGGDWSARFEPLHGFALQCHLTVGGVTRSDVGENTDYKGAASDALKRAAVHFGVARALYSMPKQWLKESDGDVRRAGKAVYVQDSGTVKLRERYAQWLDRYGIAEFGRPVDVRAASLLGSIGDWKDMAPTDVADRLEEIAALWLGERPDNGRPVGTFLSAAGVSESDFVALREIVTQAQKDKQTQEAAQALQPVAATA